MAAVRGTSSWSVWGVWGLPGVTPIKPNKGEVLADTDLCSFCIIPALAWSCMQRRHLVMLLQHSSAAVRHELVAHAVLQLVLHA